MSSLEDLLTGNTSTNTTREAVQSLKAKADAQRSPAEKIADWATKVFGSMPFLIANLIWFALWILLNTGVIPGLEPFDPFPFSLLTMLVSLEAIVLAILVLISQNRAAKVADLREEVDLHIDVTAEAELTKLLIMVGVLLEKNGVDISEDPELKKMLRPTNLEKIEQVLEQEIMKDNQ